MTTATYGTPTIAARLDRLPASKFFNRLVILISLGGLFEFYDLFMTGYIGAGLIGAKIYSSTTPNPFDLSGFASFAGASFAGMWIGTLIFSWISDRFGRRAAFTYSLLWYSIATLVMAFMSSAVWIDFWRLLAGIGVGVQLITIDAYITEITPKQSRGKYIQLTQAVTYCAVPVVALVARFAIPQVILGLDGWRWVAIVGSLGALVVWFIRARLPESPRWLETHGRQAEAEQVMSQMEDAVRAETGRELPTPQTLPDETAATKGAWSEIFSPAYRARTIMLSVFNFFQTIGFYGFAAWVPVLLLSEGITVTKSLTYVLVIALLNPFGPLIAYSFFAEKIERKWQIVGLALIIAACGLIWSEMRTAAGIIILGGLITLANNAFSGAFHAYQAELYPTRIRAQAVGFSYSWSRFSSIFIGFAIAAALARYGVTGVFVIIAIAMVIVAAVIAFFGPKTNNVRLEQLSR